MFLIFFDGVARNARDSSTSRSRDWSVPLSQLIGTLVRVDALASENLRPEASAW